MPQHTLFLQFRGQYERIATKGIHKNIALSTKLRKKAQFIKNICKKISFIINKEKSLFELNSIIYNDVRITCNNRVLAKMKSAHEDK